MTYCAVVSITIPTQAYLQSFADSELATSENLHGSVYRFLFHHFGCTHFGQQCMLYTNFLILQFIITGSMTELSHYKL